MSCPCELSSRDSMSIESTKCFKMLKQNPFLVCLVIVLNMRSSAQEYRAQHNGHSISPGNLLGCIFDFDSWSLGIPRLAQDKRRRSRDSNVQIQALWDGNASGELCTTRPATCHLNIRQYSNYSTCAFGSGILRPQKFLLFLLFLDPWPTHRSLEDEG